MWTQLLENPSALGMFAAEPSLEDVLLNHLVLDREGPTVTITVQLRDYPDKPPAKWHAQKHNAVTTDLQALGVEHLLVRGWTVDNLVSIAIERLPNKKLKIRVSSKSVGIELLCGWLRVVAVTPYRRTT